MTAGIHEFTMEQGATFDRTIAWKDDTGTLINTAGYTARMQIRQRQDDPIFLLELTDANGRIVLGISGTTNIRLLVAATATAAVSWDAPAYYDLELVSGATVTRVLQGQVVFEKEVTR